MGQRYFSLLAKRHRFVYHLVIARMSFILLIFSGVFVNNYENFLVWVNKDDQLKLVSTAQGQDLKYVLLRLQKAVIKIEEAIKSCQDKGFTSDCNGFSHSQIGVNGTGLEVRFSLALPGFRQAGRAELDKSKSDLNLTIVPSGYVILRLSHPAGII